MSYSIEGMYYENCSCDAICPCTWSNLAHPATNDDCRATLAFEVDRGEIDGVDVAGTTVVIVAHTPAAMTEGNWKVGLIVDDGASDEQVEGLAAVFSGEAGGPMANLAPLIGEVLGLERLPVDISHGDDGHHVVIGSAIDYQLTMQHAPDGGDQVQLTNIVNHPAGPTMDVAQADAVSNAAFGIEWSGDSLSGFANRFAWAA